MDAMDRPHVVVADDHPLVLHQAAQILGSLFEVTTVPSGSAAVAATLRLNPDVVVLDVSMPGVDGFRAASQIRVSGSSTRVVFLTSHVAQDMIVAAIALGASAFIPKLRMHQDLLQAVDHVRRGGMWFPIADVLQRLNRPAALQHDLQLHESDHTLVGGVTEFLLSAVRAGQSLIVVATDAHLQGFDAELRAHRVDPDRLAAQGRYVQFRATAALDAMLEDGEPDADRFESLLAPVIERSLAAAISTPAHVAMFGESRRSCARGVSTPRR